MVSKSTSDTTQIANRERKKTTSPKQKALYIGGIVVLLIIGVSFIGAPILSTSLGGQRLVFGRYKSNEIVYEQDNWFGRTLYAISQQYPSINTDDETILALQQRSRWQQAFQQTLFHTAVITESEESGLDVSESAIDQAVATNAQFIVDGKFDASLYRSLSGQQRISLRNYLRETLIREQYIEDLIFGTSVSQNELDFLASLGHNERQIRFIALNYFDYPQEEVEAFIAEEHDLFRQLDLSIITVDEQNEAMNIRNQALDQTASFEELATLHSTDSFADQEGAMGLTYFYQLEQSYDDAEPLEALFELEVGELSQIFETIDGWAFYRLEDEPKSPADPPDEELIEEADGYIQSFERGRVEDYFLALAEDLRVNDSESSLIDIASTNNLEIHTTNYFPINYGQIDAYPSIEVETSSALDGIGNRIEFFESVFSLDDGDISEPLVYRDSVFLFELASTRVNTEDYEDFGDYFPVILEDYQSELLETQLLDNDYIVDNFEAAFSRYVLAP